MKVYVNAQPHEVESERLSDALHELGYSGRAIATALNGECIPASERGSTPIRENDRLEILVPMQGG